MGAAALKLEGSRLACSVHGNWSHLNSCLDCARRIRLNIESKRTAEDMAMKSTSMTDMVGGKALNISVVSNDVMFARAPRFGLGRNNGFKYVVCL
jgi:hypothetical protein